MLGFRGFAHGAVVPDEDINAWIAECISDLKKKRGNVAQGSVFIRSGDTIVTVHDCHEVDEYCISVSTKDGYAFAEFDKNSEVPVFSRSILKP